MDQQYGCKVEDVFPCFLQGLEYLCNVSGLIVEPSSSTDDITSNLEQAQVFIEISLEDTQEIQSKVNERMEVHFVVFNILRKEMEEELQRISENEHRQQQMKDNISSKECASRDVQELLNITSKNKSKAENKFKIAKAGSVITGIASAVAMIIPEVGMPVRVVGGILAAKAITELALTIDRCNKMEREFRSQVNSYKESLRNIKNDLSLLEKDLRHLKGQHHQLLKEFRKIEHENEALHQTLLQATNLIQVIHGCSEFLGLLLGRLSVASSTVGCLTEGDIETFLITLTELANLLEGRDGSSYTRVMQTISAVKLTGQKLRKATEARTALEGEKRDYLGYI
ncbi:uncharacterized protein LOC106167288 [Lingula anatina]|uniref:Uncharacterized protein LOC106167288 n=1 Tax=Lingula anatina TaxID=7574 RepID=A0A1S3ITD8_LINAN|nr:uncharacterized protein LOC106167288 [Lingula anatina]XP_013401475.1 uncharacterized protein LOC106167288 [Lingula anatina]XP_013401477.1 uncharacterized protein LOC106167288 [Lingula anatina]|eukprot:XP_013401474.1 uncharacterized protein LOC106167288 [Lingula anatina]